MKRSKYIDHTLLKADAQEGEIIRLCDEAKQHDFASVCVYSYWARTCAEQLKGTGIKVCCVAGFPWRNEHGGQGVRGRRCDPIRRG